MQKSYIYLDNAATEPLHPAAAEAMRPYLSELFFNANSPYDVAYTCRTAVEQARAEIAQAVGAKAEEIYFTSGGCEANSWAVQTLLGGKKRHIISTTVEHHSIHGACAFMMDLGYDVTYLPVDRFGLVDPDQFEAALRPDTALASIQMVNNEMGTVQPIARLAEIAAGRGVALHTDAVQAVGQGCVNVDAQGVQLLSASAHKFGGPKGVGFLYARRGYPLRPLIHGGAQERGLRGGTANTAGIVGMAAALCARLASPEQESAVRAVREAFLARLCMLLDTSVTDGAGVRVVSSEPPDKPERMLLRLNGHPVHRAAGNLNLTFFGVDGEALMLMLARRGVLCSAGAACSSGAIGPSYVLSAIGLTKREAMSTLRFTFSPEITPEQALNAAGHTAECVKILLR